MNLIPANLSEDNKVKIQEKLGVLLTGLEEKVKEAKTFVVTDASEKAKMSEADRMRKDFKKLRTTADSVRKELKEQSNLYNNAVQSVYNAIESLCKTAEEHLELQARYAEILKEKEDKALTQKRSSQLSPYNVSAPDNILLSMDEEAFNIYLAGVKDKFLKDKQEREEKEKQEKLENDILLRNREVGQYAAYFTYFGEKIPVFNADNLSDYPEIIGYCKKKKEQYLADIEQKKKAQAELDAKKKEEEQQKEKLEKGSETSRLNSWVDQFSNPIAPSLDTPEAQVVYEDILAKYNGFVKWAKQRIKSLNGQ